MGNHVFICYAREDEAFVLKLAARLKNRGVPIWLDQWDISFGADWNKSIDDAISNCAKFLIVLSPEAVGSDEVQDELFAARLKKKTIVPVLYRDCEIPRQLLRIHYVNFTSRNSEDEMALERVVRVLGGQQPAVPEDTLGLVSRPGQIEQEALTPAPNQVKRNVPETSAQYWSLPYGEPEWITVPAGEFSMGSERGADHEKPVHRLFVPEFRIVRTPVTNAQYQLYIQATGATPPEHWERGQPPQEKLNHPVVYVSWHDAYAYCEWLGSVMGKKVRLPTEAEWEKAARGDKDQREYPWGDQFDQTKCNSSKSGLGDTSPVGTFPTGASPYGCLDMSGNVWEWVHDWYSEGYYQQGPGRNLQGPGDGQYKILRGGSWSGYPGGARVSLRLWVVPGFRVDFIGFRCAQ